jgi:polysaccharide lyase-like protein
MAMPTTRVLMLNAAASLVAIGAIVGVVRTWLAPTEMRPCSERHGTSMAFPLERDGVVLTASDIQARTGGKDAGLLENLNVLRLKRGPAPVAMSVELPKGSAAPTSSVVPKGGISFAWQPRSLKTKSTVCLSYQVLLPSDFDFNLGGAMPGLIGEADQSTDRFLVRPSWHQGGTVSVTNFVTLDGKKFKQVADAEGVTLPRGKWIQIDQELVLNSPEQENGILRLWIDGALAIDKADIAYRVKPDIAVSGVAADFFYNGEDVAGRAPTDAKVMLTPFEVRWP